MSDMCDKYSLPDFRTIRNSIILFLNKKSKEVTQKFLEQYIFNFTQDKLSPKGELDKITIPENIVKIAVDHLQKEDKQEQTKNISAAKKVEKEIDDI